MCQRLINSFVTCTLERAWQYGNRKDKFSLLGKYLRINKQSVVKLTTAFIFMPCHCLRLWHSYIAWKAWRIHCDGNNVWVHSVRQGYINPTRRLRSCPGCFMPRNVASATGPRTVAPPFSPLLYSLNRLGHLLTYSMEQSPSWETNWFCS
jgi:hypothetical protein